MDPQTWWVSILYIGDFTDSSSQNAIQISSPLPSLKTNSSPLKIDGLNTIFLLGRPIFMCYLSFREFNYTIKECSFSPNMEKNQAAFPGLSMVSPVLPCWSFFPRWFVVPTAKAAHWSRYVSALTLPTSVPPAFFQEIKRQRGSIVVQWVNWGQRFFTRKRFTCWKWWS